MYDVSDSSSDEIIDPLPMPIEYINILKKFNINNRDIEIVKLEKCQVLMMIGKVS